MKAFYILLATAFVYLVALFAGRLLFQALGVRLRRSEHRFLAFICGSACLSTLVFAVTAMGLAHKATFFALGGIILAVAWWRRVHQEPGEPLPPVPRAWNIGFWIVYGVFTWLYLGNALAPETSPDGVTYHVGLIARYLREHHFPPITTEMNAWISAGVEMLFLFAFSIAKHSAAAMVEFLFLASMPFGILAYARRIGKPEAGVVAALMFYVTPVVGKDGTVAYVDVALGAILFALFYLLQIWRDQRDNRLLPLIGLVAGFGFAAKYTALTGVAYAIAFVAFWLWRWKRPFWKPALLVASCAGFMMAPWLIKNVIVVGNPLAPYFNRWFPNPYFPVAAEDDYRAVYRAVNGVRLAEVPLEATVGGGRLEGLIGPVFLLAPLGLLALRTSPGRQVLLAAAVFGATYFSNISVRLLIPVLPFLVLSMALAATSIRYIGPVLLAAHVLLSWPAVVNRYASPDTWRIETSNWRIALRRTSEIDYIRQNVPDYDIGLAIDKLVPPNQPLLSWSSNNRSYQSRELLSPYHSLFASRLETMVRAVVTDGYRPTQRRTFRFPGRTARRLRLVLTAPAHELWSISEMRVFHGDREIPRASEWRLRASANPWDVQLAFDNSPVTLWNAWQYAEPGMFVQIDFGRDQIVDCVTADLPRDSTLPMRVEIDAASVDSTPTVEPAPYPPGMRRAAMEEMKARGVRWMVIRDGDEPWRDFLERSSQWGIRQVANRNGYRLWQVLP